MGNHYIYKTVNNLNGKFYIGRRSTNGILDKDTYLGSGLALKNAIKKYGKENFIKEIIETCPDFETLCKREVYWIKKLNAIKLGYNLVPSSTYGGVCPTGEWPEEIKKKMSNSAKGRPSPKKGKPGRKHTEEEKCKLSLINKERWRNMPPEKKKKLIRSGEDNPMFGKKLSPEMRKAVGEAVKNRKQVTCPHCGKIGKSGIMSRWHFDNCKKNPNFTPKPKKELECPHCNKKSSNKTDMVRYHFGNCLKNPSNGGIEEAKRNRRESHPMFGKKQKKVTCLHCGKVVDIPNAKKYHFDKCKCNPNNNKGDIEKKRSEHFIKIRKFVKKVICPHCGKEGDKPLMKRWHFDNCKHRN